jgi:hypothetical protein
MPNLPVVLKATVEVTAGRCWRWLREPSRTCGTSEALADEGHAFFAPRHTRIHPMALLVFTALSAANGKRRGASSRFEW